MNLITYYSSITLNYTRFELVAEIVGLDVEIGKIAVHVCRHTLPRVRMVPVKAYHWRQASPRGTNTLLPGSCSLCNADTVEG